MKENGEFLAGLDETLRRKMESDSMNETVTRVKFQISLIEDCLVKGEISNAMVQFQVLQTKCEKLWTKENLTRFPVLQKLAFRYRDLKNNLKSASGGDPFANMDSNRPPPSRAMSFSPANARAATAAAPSAAIENVFWSALCRARTERGAETALFCGAKRLAMTWTEVSHAAEGFAGYLVSMGVAHFDRVAIAAMHPTYNCILAILGTLLAGAKVAPINFRMEPKKVAQQITECAPKILLVDDMLSPLIKIAAKLPMPPAVLFVGVGEIPPGARHIDAAFSFKSEDPRPQGWGLPQGHTMEVGMFFNPSHDTSPPTALKIKINHILKLIVDVEFNPDHIVFIGLPLYHFGIIGLLLNILKAGCTAVCLREKLSALTFLKLLRVCKVNIAVMLPGLIAEFTGDVPEDTNEENATAKKVTRVLIGPASLSPSIEETARKLFPDSTTSIGFGVAKVGKIVRSFSSLSFGSLQGVDFNDFSPNTAHSSSSAMPTATDRFRDSSPSLSRSGGSQPDTSKLPRISSAKNIGSPNTAGSPMGVSGASGTPGGNGASNRSSSRSSAGGLSPVNDPFTGTDGVEMLVPSNASRMMSETDLSSQQMSRNNSSTMSPAAAGEATSSTRGVRKGSAAESREPSGSPAAVKMRAKSANLNSPGAQSASSPALAVSKGKSSSAALHTVPTASSASAGNLANGNHSKSPLPASKQPSSSSPASSPVPARAAKTSSGSQLAGPSSVASKSSGDLDTEAAAATEGEAGTENADKKKRRVASAKLKKLQ